MLPASNPMCVAKMPYSLSYVNRFIQRTIALVELESGRSCIRKTLVQSSTNNEVLVYERLREYSSDISHFILKWSVGSWTGGQYLQLPRFIPVGDEMKMPSGGHLKRHALSLCAQLSSGVHFLHSKLDIAHMDIKPDNLVLDIESSGKIMLKIIDFNISIMDAHKWKVLPGPRGTEGYMAPEVLGTSPYLPLPADRYSCGVCMMELLNVDRDEEDVNLCFEDFTVFAKRLLDQSPDLRPSLAKCPRSPDSLVRYLPPSNQPTPVQTRGVCAAGDVQLNAPITEDVSSRMSTLLSC